MLTAGILFAASGAAVGVAQDRAGGFADRVLSLPRSRTGVVVGMVAADSITVVAATLVALGVAALVGFRPHASVGALAGALALLVSYSVAFSATFGALGGLADGPQATQGFGFIAIPLTFVSRAYVSTAAARHRISRP